jgi:hypothetical protein
MPERTNILRRSRGLSEMPRRKNVETHSPKIPTSTHITMSNEWKRGGYLSFRVAEYEHKHDTLALSIKFSISNLQLTATDRVHRAAHRRDGDHSCSEHLEMRGQCWGMPFEHPARGEGRDGEAPGELPRPRRRAAARGQRETAGPFYHLAAGRRRDVICCVGVGRGGDRRRRWRSWLASRKARGSKHSK